jgi:hypothetical protein
VCILGQCFQRLLDRLRQAAQFLQFGFVCLEFVRVRQRAVDQQVGDLFELCALGEIEDVVAAIVQVVAGAPTVQMAVLPATVPDRITPKYFSAQVLYPKLRIRPSFSRTPTRVRP